MKLSTLLKNVVLPLVLVALSGLALAANPPMVADILGATGSTDKSVAVFSFLLGNFFLSPLSAFGGSSTLIGGLFMIFNGFVFLVGTLWASYGLIAGIVETAHSGEVLGKRLSAVWLPIRMVTGIAGIAPIFGGYSLAQVFIVTMAALGIGIANMMWTGAIKMTSDFNTLIPPAASMAPGSAVGVESAAMGLFQVHVCDLAQRDLNSKLDAIDPYASNLGSFTSGGDIVMYTSYGSSTNPNMCGSVTLRNSKIRGDASFLGAGFRTGSVNYDAYKAMAVELGTRVAIPALTLMDSKITTIASKWYGEYNRSISTQGAPFPEYPQAALEEVGKAYQDSILSEMNTLVAQHSARNPGLSREITDRMKKDGWFGAGAWFSTFAEANAAMADVMAALSIQVSPPDLSRQKSPAVTDVLVAIEHSKDKSAEAGAGSPAPSGDDPNQFSVVNEAICKSMGIQSSTGNCSLGQAIVKQGIRAAAIGSGGGAGGGSFDDIGLVNPIVMFKNMGDYTMTIASTVILAVKSAEMFGIIPKDGEKPGLLTSAVSDVAGSLPVVGIFAKAFKVLASLAKIIYPIAMMMLVVGGIMSIYIPLIPFITWMGGLVQYCVIVLQGLVGAPIAALSHMDAEGEGLGRRTEAGYMFVLNVTFRPALMLLGFFIASGIMIALGSFQTNLFLMAMGNAQGNSVTGLASIVGYLIVFFVLNVTLIQGLFNMIFLLPDQILSLIGAGGHMADLGKEVEGKVHNLFLRAGTVGQTGASAIGGAQAAAKAAKAKALEKAGKAS